jgi:hypothetical protein
MPSAINRLSRSRPASYCLGQAWRRLDGGTGEFVGQVEQFFAITNSEIRPRCGIHLMFSGSASPRLLALGQRIVPSIAARLHGNRNIFTGCWLTDNVIGRGTCGLPIGIPDARPLVLGRTVEAESWDLSAELVGESGRFSNRRVVSLRVADEPA